MLLCPWLIRSNYIEYYYVFKYNIMLEDINIVSVCGESFQSETIVVTSIYEAEMETSLSSRESSEVLCLYSRAVVLTLCVVTSLGVS